MKKMKYLISLMCFLFLSMVSVNAEGTPSREINIIYDDSSSMIYKYYDREYVDYWAKAKFSLELLCSSMGEEDTVNIYPMSDYSDLNLGVLPIDQYISEKTPILTLYGKMSPEERVSSIEGMVTEALDTPFFAVGKAFNDLRNSTADEKWLVILTDGKFDEVLSSNQLTDLFRQLKEYDPEVRILYMGMDSNAFRIDEDLDNGIYTEYADDPSKILSAFTRISYRLFNRNQIDISSGNRIEFDVPMEKIVVFAQGEGASVGDMVYIDGSRYEPTSEVVIPASTVAATNYADNPNVIYNNDLTGVVAEYEYDISEGNYRFEIENSDNVEVFYYPSVGLTINLLDEYGNDVYGDENINSGTYTVKYKFTNAVTGEELMNTDLLGDIEFSAQLTRDGEVISQDINDGDEIELSPGLETLKISAEYLKYNKVEDIFDFNVVNYKSLQYTVIEKPAYQFGTNVDTNFDLPIKLALRLDGQDLSEEFWNKVPLPEVTAMAVNGAELDFHVEKSGQVGVYDLYITNDPDELNSQIINQIHIKGYYEEDSVFYSGDYIDVVEISDMTPGYIQFLRSHWYLFAVLAVLIVLLILLTKKSMPKMIYFRLNRVLIDGERTIVNTEFEYLRNRRELKISAYPYSDEAEYVILHLEPTESSLIARIKNPSVIAIRSIETSANVRKVSVSKDTYVNVNGKWVLEKYADNVEMKLSERQKLRPANNNITVTMDNGMEAKVLGEIQRY